MTIYAPLPPDFTCAVCFDEWRRTNWTHPSPHNPIPPICRRCEEGAGWNGRGFRSNRRDERLIRHVKVLADAIMSTAYCREKGYPHV